MVERATALILGGGWGGLAVAHRVRERLPAEHRVVVVERKPTFSLCTSYLWLLTGERDRAEDVRRDLGKLARPGIEWLQADVEGIDPVSRLVRTSAGPIEADHLVIALGADLVPDAVPGLAEGALNLYDADAVVRLRDSLSTFRGGRVVVVIARMPFKCPAAPYEATFLVEWLLRERGVRDRAEIMLCTPEKAPMPVAGPDVGTAVKGMLEARGIEFRPGRLVSGVDAATRTAAFDAEAVPFDILVTVPPHRAPPVVVEAGLTDGTGYVPVHPQTLEILADAASLETHHPGVYALGDVTAIRLLNGLLLPKAGVFAEGEADAVAESIAASVEGRDVRGRYDGTGFCYLELGGGEAGYVSGNFYAYPEPHVTLEPPSAKFKRAKEEFERVLETWFMP